MTAYLKLREKQKERLPFKELLPYIRADNEEWAAKHRASLVELDAQRKRERKEVRKILERRLSSKELEQVRKIICI